MLNTTTRTGAGTFVLAVSAVRSWLQPERLRPTQVRLGIAGRLAISFSAVAVLAIVANLIVDGTVWRIIEVTEERAAPVAPAPARVTPAAKTATPAPLRTAFPSADALLLAMDRLANVVDASAEGDLTELSARYQKLGIELEHAAAEFVGDDCHPFVQFRPPRAWAKRHQRDVLQLGHLQT